MTVTSNDRQFTVCLLIDGCEVTCIKSALAEDFLMSRLAEALMLSGAVGRSPPVVAEDILCAFSGWLRFYVINPDFRAKWVYSTRDQIGRNQLRAHQQQLCSDRLAVLRLLIRVRDECLHPHLAGHDFAWLQRLDARLDEVLATLERIKAAICPLKDVFDWVLCTLHQSSSELWRSLARRSEGLLVEKLIEDTRSFLTATEFSWAPAEFESNKNLG